MKLQMRTLGPRCNYGRRECSSVEGRSIEASEMGEAEDDDG